MSKTRALQENAKKEAEHLLSELCTLGDEIRLKAHLANAEGREAWKRFEPQLLQYRRQLETCSEAALGELRAAGSELRSKLERLRQDLRQSRSETSGV
jgi:hypothetical protein